MMSLTDENSEGSAQFDTHTLKENSENNEKEGSAQFDTHTPNDISKSQEFKEENGSKENQGGVRTESVQTPYTTTTIQEGEVVSSIHIPPPTEMYLKYLGGSAQYLRRPFFFAHLKHMDEFVSAMRKPCTPDVMYCVYNLGHPWANLISKHTGIHHANLLRQIQGLLDIGIIKKIPVEKVDAEPLLRAHEKRNGFSRKAVSYVYKVPDDWYSLVSYYLDDPTVDSSIKCKDSVKRDLNKIEKVKDLYAKQQADAPYLKWRRYHKNASRLAGDQWNEYLQLDTKEFRERYAREQEA